MPMQPVTGGAPTLPGPAMSAHALHECTPAMSLHPISDCVPAVSMPAMTKPTWPVNECTLTAPGPVASGLVACTHTVSTAYHFTVPMHVVSQSTVSGPMLPEGKPQHHTSSLVARPSTPPATSVTQPQVVLIKQYQQPKPYTGASSWKGCREYFERLAAVK